MNGRDTAGRFAAGNSGRPAGARNRATMTALALLDGQAEALTQRAVEMALAGDTVALRLCMDRIAPPKKDTPVSFAIPAMTSAKDAAEAAGAVLQAVSAGDLTPTEAAQVMGLVDSYRRTLEVTDLEGRMARMESIVSITRR